MKALLLILVLLPWTCLAGEIPLGMTTALTGPAGKLGQAMRLGIETCFKAVNDAGGIHGARIRLHVLDDGYEPVRAARNMRALIDRYKVRAFIGNVGTPTAILTAPIANETHTLMFGALSGARILRDKQYRPYVINYRASYAEETAAMIRHLLDNGIAPREIAFFTQRDSYGDDGYQGALAALRAHGFNDADQLTHARYTRNSLNVEGAVADILDAPVTPRAIIMVASYAPAAKFIRLLRQDLPGIQFLNVSFVGAKSLVDALGDAAEGVIVTQVVPPYASDLRIARRFRADLARFRPDAEPGYVSFEGYIVACLFAEGLRRAGPDPTSDDIIRALESIHGLDMGLGIPISFGPDKHQALHRVWPSRYQGGRFIGVEWLDHHGAKTGGRSR